LTSLAYLWRRDQRELLAEMIACKLKAVVIKVAALGNFFYRLNIHVIFDGLYNFVLYLCTQKLQMNLQM